MAAPASPDTVVSHWSTLLENFQASPLQFYQSVEAALQRRQVPDTKNDRVEYKEAGLLSARREYLHVTREKLVFDVCAAPFGTGFFVSWWLAETRPNLNPVLKLLIIFGMFGLLLRSAVDLGLFIGPLLVLLAAGGALWFIHTMAAQGEFSDDFVRVIPFVGPAYVWLFKPDTYYRQDTMLMFQKAVHNAVLEVVDEITQAKGLRVLGEGERKPIMREFYHPRVA